MAELTTLARPYAKAAFGFALASQDLDAWSKMLNLLASVTTEATVQGVLTSPALTSDQQVAALKTVCGEELNEVGLNFITLLAENKRLLLLSDIAEQFNVLKAKQEKMTNVEITSAYDIDSESSDKLAKALTNKLNSSVKINSTVDKNLIGGVVIRAGDLVIDNSVRGRLAKLNEAIAS